VSTEIRERQHGLPPITSTAASPLRTLWLLVYPLILASSAQVLLTTVDTAILGRTSTGALASVALAAPVYIVATVVLRGWTTGVQAFTARRVGEGRSDRVGELARIAIPLIGGAAIFLSAVLFMVAPAAMGAIGAHGTVAQGAVDYLRIIGLALPLVAVAAILQAIYSGLGATRVALYTAVLINIVHIPLALALVVGLSLDVRGAALSSLAANAAGLAFMVWYGWWRYRERLVGSTGTWLESAREIVPTLWRVGWPETVMLVLGYFTPVLLLSFIVDLGAETVAAYRVLGVVGTVLFTLVAACSNGVSIIAGQRLGAGLPEDIAPYRRATLFLGAMLTAAVAVPVVVAPSMVLAALTADQVVQDLSAAVVPIAVGHVPMMLGAMTLAGILRAAGDTKTNMIASVAADYACYVPLAWFLSGPAGFGLAGVYLGTICYWSVRLLITLFRYRGGVWRSVAV